MTPDPLAGIDDIAWDGLRHAYGTAEDVPDALRGFLSSAEADDACSFVTGSLWHQGTIFQATAVAIPFLVSLLGAPGVARRGSLASGLVGIAGAAAGSGSTSAARRAALRALEKSAPALLRAATKLEGSPLVGAIAFVFAMIPEAARRALGKMPESVAGAVVEAMERADAIAQRPEGERDEALWEWQRIVDEGVEDLEIDPPHDEDPAAGAPPPAPAPAEPSGRSLEASFDDWGEWDRAKEGPSPGEVFAAKVEAEMAGLRAACEADRLPPRISRERATSTFLYLQEGIRWAEHPVPHLRRGGCVGGYDDTVRIEWPAWVDGGQRRERFAVRAVVGPIRALSGRLQGVASHPEITLERGEGRFTLILHRPVEDLTFASFVRALDAVLGERERLLAIAPSRGSA